MWRLRHGLLTPSWYDAKMLSVELPIRDVGRFRPPHVRQACNGAICAVWETSTTCPRDSQRKCRIATLCMGENARSPSGGRAANDGSACKNNHPDALRAGVSECIPWGERLTEIPAMPNRGGGLSEAPEIRALRDTDRGPELSARKAREMPRELDSQREGSRRVVAGSDDAEQREEHVRNHLQSAEANRRSINQIIACGNARSAAKRAESDYRRGQAVAQKTRKHPITMTCKSQDRGRP